MSFRAVQITLATITLVMVAVPIVEITAQIDVPDGPADERMAAYSDIPILRFGLDDKKERFITPEDPEIVKIATTLENAPEPYRAALAWVHGTIAYVSDDEAHGQREYWQYPAETVHLGTGDCEDMAMLLTSLCRALGYDAVLISMPEHTASAVRIDGEYVTLEATNGRVADYTEYRVIDYTMAYALIYVAWPITGIVLALMLVLDIGSRPERTVYTRPTEVAA